MKVIVAQSAGFCWGVKRAVEKARALAQRTGSRVYTDGPLIHNEEMIAQLQREGIVEAPETEAVSAGVMLIRAHGVSPERRSELGRLPVPLHDATCPDVARIQGLIKRYAAQGCHIVIYGDPGHAEVTGLLGYAQGRGHVVARSEDVAALPDMDPVCVVSQSTQFPDRYREIAAAVVARFPGAVVLDTICEATRNRQAELLTLAPQVDAIVVVGGRHSANTLRLVELARRLKPTFYIQTPDQLRPEEMAPFRTVCLTAGASTPDFIIQAVQKALEAMPAGGR